MAFSLASFALALASLHTSGQDAIVQSPAPDQRTVAANFVRDGSIAPLGDTPAFAAILTEDARRQRLVVVSFHMRWLSDGGGDRRPIWFARRRSAEFRTASTDYADGRTCGPLHDVLQAMESLELPVVDVAGVPLGDPPPSRLNRGLDGQTFSLNLTGEFRSTRGYGDLTVSGDQTSPVAALARLAEVGMASCWGTQSPAWAGEEPHDTSD